MTVTYEITKEYPAPFVEAVRRLRAYGLLFDISLGLWPDAWFFLSIPDPTKATLRFWDERFVDDDGTFDHAFVVKVSVGDLKDERVVAQIEEGLRRTIETGLWPREAFEPVLTRERSTDAPSAAGPGS